MVSGVTPGDTLIVVPDGSLRLVPFEALVPNGGTSEVSTEVRYLGDVFSIQYAQSATVLSNARTSAVDRANYSGGEVMVLADPVFGEADSRWPSVPGSRPAETSIRSISVEASNRPRLPRLQKTDQLLHSLNDVFGSRHVRGLSGLQASERALRELRLADYRYLVFATHGVMEGQLRYLGEPALVLAQSGVDRFDAEADGYLTLSEVMELHLNAEVAALTACDTGVGVELDGEGVLGLGWAFEYAGARNVVVSLWSVDQASTVLLMQNFFAHLREGKRPPEALRLGRRELRKAGYTHPFFWAPFISFGEG